MTNNAAPSFCWSVTWHALHDSSKSTDYPPDPPQPFHSKVATSTVHTKLVSLLDRTRSPRSLAVNVVFPEKMLLFCSLVGAAGLGLCCVVACLQHCYASYLESSKVLAEYLRCIDDEQAGLNLSDMDYTDRAATVEQKPHRLKLITKATLASKAHFGLLKKNTANTRLVSDFVMRRWATQNHVSWCDRDNIEPIAVVLTFFPSATERKGIVIPRRAFFLSGFQLQTPQTQQQVQPAAASISH